MPYDLLIKEMSIFSEKYLFLLFEISNKRYTSLKQRVNKNCYIKSELQKRGKNKDK